MIERDPADPYLDANLAFIYAAIGRREAALRLIEKLKEIPEEARIKGQLLAFAYCGLGDLDAAFDWWRFAASEKETFIGWLRSYPLFEDVRSDKRYDELLRSMNLE
jgi:tetratricopeptide (TPR) repeat protein